MDFNINTIFPTSFISSNIGREITKEELEAVALYGIPGQTHKNQGNTTSLKRYILRDDPAFVSIKEFIDTGVKHYLETIVRPPSDVQYFITQSWLNFTKPAEYHHKHEHPNSLLSGVFYLNADKENDKIYFYNENQYQRIKIQPVDWNYYNSRSWWYPVGTGDLIIFPSELTHMVDVTTSKETRISLAFNVFAKGAFGQEDHLTALYL
jgi:uncharacterized protein (TIGR02466 family)